MSSQLEGAKDLIREQLARGQSQNQLALDFGVARSTMQTFIKRHLADAVQEKPNRSERVQRGQHDAITVIERDYSHMDSIRVYPMGDLHIGSAHHERDLLDEWLAYILDEPRATLLNTGDNLNSAISGSKSNIYQEILSVEDSIEDLERRLTPLADAGRLDAIFDGNHENRITNAVGFRPNKIVARNLGVPHVDGSALIKYYVGDQAYKVYVRHGTGNAPASLNAVMKSANITPADVYVTGHTHQQSVVLDDYFVEQDGQMVRVPRRYVTSGAFTGYEMYAAQRGYVPSHCGAPRIFLDGSTHDVHVSI